MVTVKLYLQRSTMDFDPFKLSFKIFRTFGLWRDKHSSWFYVLYGITIHLIFIEVPGKIVLLIVIWRQLLKLYILSVIIQTINLFASQNVKTLSNLFNIYCSYWALILKTINFIYRFREISALKDSLHQLIITGEFDENADNFVKKVKQGYMAYRSLLFSGMIRFVVQVLSRWFIFYASEFHKPSKGVKFQDVLTFISTTQFLISSFID